MATNPVAAVKSKPPEWLRELAGGVAHTLIGATFFMLGMEHAHSLWPVVTPIGWWDSFLLLVAIDVVISAILFGVRVKTLGAVTVKEDD